jgi:hypothetical protein
MVNAENSNVQARLQAVGRAEQSWALVMLVRLWAWPEMYESQKLWAQAAASVRFFGKSQSTIWSILNLNLQF